MERPTRRLQLCVNLFTTSSSVRSVANISMKCVLGKKSNQPNFFKKIPKRNLTINISFYSISTPFSRRRDLVLWLWNSHNKVNERLIKEESSLGTGDPKFPKMIWPHKQFCPSCYLSQSQKNNMRSRIEWDNDEVFKFLVSYYGKTLVTLYKDNDHLHGDGGTVRALAEDLGATTNAVVVPVGAALAIAVASCAFGALGWFWRTQQKNRKYLYLHTLKNI